MGKNDLDNLRSYSLRFALSGSLHSTSREGGAAQATTPSGARTALAPRRIYGLGGDNREKMLIFRYFVIFTEKWPILK